MKSLGAWHKKVPTELKANLAFRREMWLRAEESPALQADILDVSANDFQFYVNAFVWQYNPRRPDTEVEPFILWDFQVPVVELARETLFVRQEDVVWEKSRELGATWLALILFDWVARFSRMKQLAMMSYKEDSVKDKGSKDSLFWKVQFIGKHLPEWMGPVKSRKSGFHYEQTGSDLVGHSTTQKSLVGGRGTLLLDEFGLQADDWAIWSNTRDVGPRLVVSTHYGLETKFFDLCQRSSVTKSVMHWSGHPLKRPGLYSYDPDRPTVPKILDKSYVFPQDYPFILDGSPSGGPYVGIRSPWYDRECEARHSARDVAMHLDIDPRGATHQFFDPIVIRGLIEDYEREPVFVGDLHYDSVTAEPRGLVAAPGGPLKLWLSPKGDGSMPVGQWVCGVDVAAGTGNTPSCLSIGNAKTGEKVLEYANAHIQPERFAYFTAALCRLFKNEWGDGAYLIWEADGAVGKVFGTFVYEDVGYRRVYYHEPAFKTLVVPLRRTQPGWFGNKESKRLLLEELRAAYAKHLLVNPSRAALEECLDFEYTGSRGVEHAKSLNTNDPSQARENHGDRVIADGLMWKGIQEIGGLATPEEKRQEAAVPWGSIAQRRRDRARAGAEEEFGRW